LDASRLDAIKAVVLLMASDYIIEFGLYCREAF